MAGPRQPTKLVQLKGAKHFTKQELAARLAAEVQPCTDDMTAPAYLTAAQKKKFDKLADQLQKIEIMGETDVDTLARFVVAQDLYEDAVKDLRKFRKAMPKDDSAETLLAWATAMEKLDKRVDRYAKQAQALARDLGLTISSRCKLQVPAPKDDGKPKNKFAQFTKVAGAE